ncbi:MAG: helix-turn-helix domain-containing protein [Solirubrobacterales bacterium]|nr:helix-turn-helix domain-containing protein [Solirubrobacterales bacterium]
MPDLLVPTNPLPDPGQRATITVEEAGAFLGVSRTSAYAAAHRGEIPTIRIGKKLLVPVARLRAMVETEHVS